MIIIPKTLAIYFLMVNIQMISTTGD